MTRALLALLLALIPLASYSNELKEGTVIRGAAQAASPQAAAPAPKRKAGSRRRGLPGVDVEFLTKDGWAIQAKYHAAPDEEGAMTFVLLSARGQRKERWYYFARGLARRGHGVLAVDMRGHGRSRIGPDGELTSWRKFSSRRSKNQFAEMTNDIEAAFIYLLDQDVPEETIGIIGDRLGGSLGLKYAAIHSKIPLVVWLTPGLNFKRVTAVNSLKNYRGGPILMVYAEDDRYSSRATPILHQVAKMSIGEAKASVFTVPGTARGTGMLRKASLTRARDRVDEPVDLARSPEISTGTVIMPGDDPEDEESWDGQTEAKAETFYRGQ